MRVSWNNQCHQEMNSYHALALIHLALNFRKDSAIGIVKTKVVEPVDVLQALMNGSFDRSCLCFGSRS